MTGQTALIWITAAVVLVLLVLASAIFVSAPRSMSFGRILINMARLIHTNIDMIEIALSPLSAYLLSHHFLRQSVCFL